MEILRVLRTEERKLLQAAGKIEGELSRIRAAINALASNGAGRRHPRRGKKLSAAHRKAIKDGIRKAKMKAGK
jgi:hypothetical protein